MLGNAFENRFGAADYVPEGGSRMDISIRSTYEAREKKVEHDKLLKKLQAQYPEVILARHRTVDVLLLAGANPLQQVFSLRGMRAYPFWHPNSPMVPPSLPGCGIDRTQTDVTQRTISNLRWTTPRS